MTTETILSSMPLPVTDQPERQRGPAEDAARIERLFLVTVGLVAGAEIGLVLLWLVG